MRELGFLPQEYKKEAMCHKNECQVQRFTKSSLEGRWRVVAARDSCHNTNDQATTEQDASKEHLDRCLLEFIIVLLPHRLAVSAFDALIISIIILRS
jgi:hypothetical protein